MNRKVLFLDQLLCYKKASRLTEDMTGPKRWRAIKELKNSLGFKVPKGNVGVANGRIDQGNISIAWSNGFGTGVYKTPDEVIEA